MGYLQGRGIHVDRHLTNVALNYRPRGFVADMVFPLVPVMKQTDMIKVYNQADIYRRERTTRAPGYPANKVDFSVNSDSYICKNYALGGHFTIEDRANADPAFILDFEAGRIRRVMDSILLDQEVRIATQLNSSSNVGTSSNVASSWTDYTNSDPLADILTVMHQIEDSTGYLPNAVVFGGDAWRNARVNNRIIDKISETSVTGGAKFATELDVARLLEVDQVLVGRSYYNTAEEGQAISLTRIWGDHVLVAYVPELPSIEEPSLGYRFRWVAPGLANMGVERHPYDSRIKADEFDIGYYQDEKIIAKPLGGLVMWTGSSQ